MIEISIMVEGQQGLTWPRWKRLVEAADEAGFYGLYRSDHFTDPQPPDRDSLELLVSLAYLADRSERVRFGPLVSPLSFREPVTLARQALALDDLSVGRFVLGVGAGWQEREHEMFGYELGDMDTRMRRLEEGLEVISRLLRSDGPASFDGEHYRLRDARFLPGPARSGSPPIMVGGSGPRRTLPLVARYADIWNSLRMSPAEFRECSALLDGLIEEAGRRPEDVKRTLFTEVRFAASEADLGGVLARIREDHPSLDGRSDAETLEFVRGKQTIIGTAEMVAAQLGEFEAAGVQEIVLRWTEQDDMEGLREFGAAVLPRFAGAGA
jgi:F420-dependent oxidoreductase-like protein